MHPHPQNGNSVSVMWEQKSESLFYERRFINLPALDPVGFPQHSQQKHSKQYEVVTVEMAISRSHLDSTLFGDSVEIQKQKVT